MHDCRWSKSAADSNWLWLFLIVSKITKERNCWQREFNFFGLSLRSFGLCNWFWCLGSKQSDAIKTVVIALNSSAHETLFFVGPELLAEFYENDEVNWQRLAFFPFGCGMPTKNVWRFIIEEFPSEFFLSFSVFLRSDQKIIFSLHPLHHRRPAFSTMNSTHIFKPEILIKSFSDSFHQSRAEKSWHV